MLVKTLLAVIIFAGIGTIIIGGAYMISGIYKNKAENKIVKPVEELTINEIVDFKVKGYSQTFSYESASMSMDCGFVDGKINSGEFQGKELIVFLPNHTVEKYPKKDEIIKIFITNKKNLLRNKFGDIYKKEFPYYCLEDKDMDDWKKNDYAFQKIFAFKMPDKKEKTNTSDWQTYRNEKYGFEMKYPEEWNIQEDLNRAIGAVFLADVYNNKNNKILDIIITEKSKGSKIEEVGGANTKKEIFKINGVNAMKEYYNTLFIRTTIETENSYILFEISAEEKIERTISKDDLEILDQILSSFKFIEK